MKMFQQGQFLQQPNETPESIARKRQAIMAMMGASASGPPVTAGLTSLGNAIGGRLREGEIDRKERQGQAFGQSLLGSALSKTAGGPGLPQYTPAKPYEVGAAQPNAPAPAADEALGGGRASAPVADVSRGDNRSASGTASEQDLGVRGKSPMELASSLIGAGEKPDNAVIREYLARGGQNLDPATTAWCAAFVNSALNQSGSKGTGKLNARSFMNWGEGTKNPQVGDVAVFSRGDPNGWKGHVGFYQGMNPDGTINVLGGNQGDAVNVKAYSADRLLGYRRDNGQGIGGGTSVPTTSTTPMVDGSGGNALVGSAGDDLLDDPVASIDAAMLGQSAPPSSPAVIQQGAMQRSGVDAQQQGATPQQPGVQVAQAGGIDPAVMKALLNPWVPKAAKAEIMRRVQQQQQRSDPLWRAQYLKKMRDADPNYVDAEKRAEIAWEQFKFGNMSAAEAASHGVSLERLGIERQAEARQGRLADNTIADTQADNARADQRLGLDTEIQRGNLGVARAAEERQSVQGRLTGPIKEYQFYQAQELQAGRQPMPFNEFAQKMKRSGAARSNVNVNTGDGGLPGLSKLGEGMTYLYDKRGQVKRDERGAPIAVAIQGTDKAREIENAETARGKAAKNRLSTAGVVLQDIRRATDLIKGESVLSPVTGMTGVVSSGVPGSDAANARALTETVKANIGFDRLQQMRESSPTGGALGSVTERELATLQAVMGSLDYSQSADQLLANLARLEAVYAAIINKAAATGDGTFKPIEGERAEADPNSTPGVFQQLLGEGGDGWTDAGNGVRIRRKGN